MAAIHIQGADIGITRAGVDHTLFTPTMDKAYITGVAG